MQMSQENSLSVIENTRKEQRYNEKVIGSYCYGFSDLLGKGTFGSVYKGKNRDTGEVVAIKVINKNLISSEVDQFLADSLKQEIKIMEKLKSDHIVKMFDVLGTKNNIYMMIEYCNGGDLRQLLKKNKGSLDEYFAIEILRQLMDGFKEIIKNQFIHRDIKPENSLIHNGNFKVADFGFATKIDITGRKLMKEFVGSPLYMSPQILQQKPYSAKSDIWSIGMMFYEMIFGKTPWPCRDINSLLKAIKTVPLRFPYDKPISQITKDFLKMTLQIEEDKRINWDEIFEHPLIKSVNIPKGIQTKQERILSNSELSQVLDEKSKKALKKVQDIVQNYKIDIQDIFNHFDKDKSGKLDEKEFHNFLCKIDPNLTFLESTNVFEKIDRYNQKSITFEQFAILFNEYDFSDLTDFASVLINELREIIKTYKLNLKDIFINFDKDSQGTLDFKEFSNLLGIIAPGLKVQEIKQVFKKFDTDGDKQITFLEFESTINNNPGSQGKQTSDDKARKMLTQLNKIIQSKQLDKKKIFDNFDLSGDQELSFNEIKKLMMVFDKRILDEEVNYVLKYLDQDGNGSVSFQEFEKALQ